MRFNPYDANLNNCYYNKQDLDYYSGNIAQFTSDYKG